MEMKAESSGNGEAPPGPPAALHHHCHHHNHNLQQGQTDGHELNVRGLLALARQLLNEGKPSLALQAVTTNLNLDDSNPVIAFYFFAWSVWREERLNGAVGLGWMGMKGFT